MNSEIRDLAKLVEFDQAGRMKKDLCETRMFNVVLACLETDQKVPSRPEPYDVCFYVIEDEGDERKDLNAGSMIFAPANVARGIRSTKRLSILGIQEAH